MKVFREKKVKRKLCPTCGEPAKAAVYCSLECYWESIRTSFRTFFCEYCKNKFERSDSEAQRKTPKFCSRECSFAYRAERADTARSNKRAQEKWRERVRQIPEMWAKQAIRGCRKSAAKKGMKCTISVGDLLPLPEVCPLLGVELIYGRGARGYGRRFTASVDRIDPLKDYIPGNVWVISYRANTIKNNATWEELRTMVACWKSALSWPRFQNTAAS
jgi:hypothetical protein